MTTSTRSKRLHLKFSSPFKALSTALIVLLAALLFLPTVASAGTGTNFVDFAAGSATESTAGPTGIVVTTIFQRANPDALTGNIDVTVEVYQGANDSALYADGGALGLCRTVNGADTTLVGTESFSFAYGAVQVTDTRTVAVAGAIASISAGGNALYAVTSYEDPTHGTIWSTCAYIPVEAAGPSECDLNPDFPGCGGGGGVGGEPGWGGFSGPSDGHRVTIVEMCDGSAQVTVLSMAEDIANAISTPIRVNGVVALIVGMGDSHTFVVPAGDSRDVEYSGPQQTSWFPVEGNPGNTTSDEQNCQVETTTTTAAETTTTVAETTTTAVAPTAGPTTAAPTTPTTQSTAIDGNGAQGATSTTAAPATLAFTGASTNYLLALGLMLTAGGAAMVATIARQD